MIEAHFEKLKERALSKNQNSIVTKTPMQHGGFLISVSDVPLGQGWNRNTTTVLFVAPPGYPNAAPDCFWVEPGGLKLEGGGIPNASNEGNSIPGDPINNRSTTWFSWHVQAWNPNSAYSLLGYYQRILDRLLPAR